MKELIGNLRFGNDGKHIDSDRVVAVPNLDGSSRLLDKRTGFQSNHIAPETRNWRTTFTQQQIDRVNALSQAWLRRHGFEV